MEILNIVNLFSIRTRPAAAILAVMQPSALKVWRPLVSINCTVIKSYCSSQLFLNSYVAKRPPQGAFLSTFLRPPNIFLEAAGCTPAIEGYSILAFPYFVI